MRFIPKVKTEERVKLDLKDKRILALLSLNARMSITQIAKKVALSRDAIGYRIKAYSDKGLIQGYRAVVDTKKLGFDNYHIFLKLNSPQKEDEKKLIEMLLSLKFIRTIIKYSGKYDFEIALSAKSIYEFEILLEKITAGCSRYILDYEILVITRNYRVGAFPRNFLDIEYEERTTFENYKLDKKDWEILRIISDDARMKLYKIAEKTKLSADAVNYRLKKMVRAGYILYFVPAVNYEMLGYGMYAVLMSFRSLSRKEESTLKEFFKTDRNILWAVKTIGKYNALFYISADNVNAVHETIQHLRSYFPEKIKEYETLIAYEEYKYSYLPEA